MRTQYKERARRALECMSNLVERGQWTTGTFHLPARDSSDGKDKYCLLGAAAHCVGSKRYAEPPRFMVELLFDALPDRSDHKQMALRRIEELKTRKNYDGHPLYNGATLARHIHDQKRSAIFRFNDVEGGKKGRERVTRVIERAKTALA